MQLETPRFEVQTPKDKNDPRCFALPSSAVLVTLCTLDNIVIALNYSSFRIN